MSRAFLSVFGVRSPGERIEKVAAYAARQQYAVVPLRPGTKVPDLCTLNDRDRKRAGDHQCGVHHAMLDPAEAQRVFTRLGKKFDQPLNIGVVAYPSRLVVIDADTGAACTAFRAAWARSENDPRRLGHSPTVRTPGARTATGEWKHRDGGHWYFTVPDGMELELGRQVIKATGGYEIRWGMSMTVVPPSTRPEGPYVSLGNVVDCPPFLLDQIAADVARVSERRALHGSRFHNDAIAEWSVSVTWTELLAAAGWRDTSKLDGCGCPIFEKPGGGSTGYKSATGHEAECDRWENFEGHGPLHLWTTDPPPPLDEWLRVNGPTITKLQYVALTQYGGDVEAAKVGLGITPATIDWIDSLPEAASPVVVAAEPVEDRSTALDGIAAEFGITTEEELKALRAVVRQKRRWEAADAIVAHLYGEQTVDDWTSKQGELGQVLEAVLTGVEDDLPGVLHRSGGGELFPKEKLHTLWGQSETGKSWLCCLAIKQVIEKGERAVYYDFEDTARTFLSRMVQIGTQDLAEHVRSGRLGYCNPTTEPTAMAFEKLERYDLVVVDSISEVISALRDPTMTGVTVRRVMRLFRNLAALGASVIVIAHQTEKGPADSPMGPSEFKAAVTGQEVKLVNVVPFSKAGAGLSRVYVSKDRGDRADCHVDTSRSKSERRLWGEMTMTAGALEGDEHAAEYRDDVTTVEVRAAVHQAEPTKGQQVEQRVMQHYESDDTPLAVSELKAVLDLDYNLMVARATLDRVMNGLEKLGQVHPCHIKPSGGKPAQAYGLGRAEDCKRDEHGG